MIFGYIKSDKKIEKKNEKFYKCNDLSLKIDMYRLRMELFSAWIALKNYVELSPGANERVLLFFSETFFVDLLKMHEQSKFG